MNLPITTPTFKPEALLGVGKIYERGVSDYLVKKIFEFLKNGFHEISSSLDLSFEYDLVADEKIPFLAYLASVLKEHSFFPYEPPAGSKRFRNLIADFMKMYHHIPLNADNVVFPSRAVWQL
ncbi:methionine S-methyltransferase-like [Citrus sinensis]|uniref:methionine S-methyltransferase-like n=1 Tax=Citrus clementina TaxID=85681 RepID=UPI000CED791A|nr:methionine S-methyltransferase-like [Citrus x clementina]XP_052297996.1 methionine S-methyltransferase-like [Citrus sinensis]